MPLVKSSNQITKDLKELLLISGPDLRVWEKQNLLITGGTGFFGKWLLETLQFARETGRIRFGHIFVLSRDPDSFTKSYPHLQNFEFIQGDVRSFKFPNKKIHGLIHGATSASAKLNSENPQEMFDTIVEGTRRSILCAKESPGCRFLMLSSGAVYGKKNLGDGPSGEEDFNCSDRSKLNDAYADGKREAERLTVSQDFNGSTVIARCFAFVGPYLPLREHFAIGNFIANVLDGEEIVIKGDGSPRRTYLYPSELVSWLFAVFSRGQQNRPYNVGAKTIVSIEEVATLVSKEAVKQDLNQVPIRILQKPKDLGSVPCYAPNTERAEIELGLRCKISLEDAIGRTVKYHLEKRY
jgi:dTDP-glucose 4,6-dehydratase